MSDHIGIMDGGAFRCLHCGSTYNPHEGGKPVALWAMAALAKGFAKEHEHCDAPKKPLCDFCASPDHPWEEHVTATTKSAADWPTCGDTGESSRAIWAHMTGRSPPRSEGASLHPHPLDGGDLGPCIRLLSAPWAAGWRERMPEMAKRSKEWAALVSAWPELEALYAEERAAKKGAPPRLYKRMKQILRGAP